MPAKTERIDIRTSQDAKDLLQRAAATVHKTVSEFLLDAGLVAASEALADRRLFGLGEAEWPRLNEVLERPVQPKPRLAKLLDEPSVLD